MNSQKLLRETERAADPELITMQDRMVKSQSEMKTMTDRLAVIERNLNSLKVESRK
jgi:hypothetical protein